MACGSLMRLSFQLSDVLILFVLPLDCLAGVRVRRAEARETTELKQIINQTQNSRLDSALMRTACVLSS